MFVMITSLTYFASLAQIRLTTTCIFQSGRVYVLSVNKLYQNSNFLFFLLKGGVSYHSHIENYDFSHLYFNAFSLPNSVSFSLYVCQQFKG